MIDKDYLDVLRERASKTRVHKKHQLTGLLMAQNLNDPKHKTLYMKIAKYISNQKLMELTKDIAERKNVDQAGAYFMKIAKEKGFIDIISKFPNSRKKENAIKRKRKSLDNK